MSSAARATLSVRLQPNASQNEVTGFREGIIYLKVTAPPIENAANRALEAFLADLLGVRRSQVSILQGRKSRHKTLEITGMTQAQANEKLAKL